MSKIYKAIVFGSWFCGYHKLGYNKFCMFTYPSLYGNYYEFWIGRFWVGCSV